MKLNNFLSDYLRQRRCRSLSAQIGRLHPELNCYSGEEKINQYALLAFRFFPTQRDPVLGEKPVFNEAVADAHPEILERALAYLSIESPIHYHRELIKMAIQNQDLNQVVKEQKQLIETLTHLRDIHMKAVEAISRQSDVMRQSIEPHARLN